MADIDAEKIAELRAMCREEDRMPYGMRWAMHSAAALNALPALLDALEGVTRERDEARAALEVSREALTFIADDGPFTKHTRVARDALAKLPRSGT